MTLLALLYIALGFGALSALAAMILRIGTLLGECQQSRAVARAGSVTIATRFAAIGAGGVILIGGWLMRLCSDFSPHPPLPRCASGWALPRLSAPCAP
ncbi:hypothetical protein OS189_11165 [Sulfitobacter sp. F26169L]|uniref:hypothetical protein n=1 Tax=Sulfitobacter sp. F26169L TaxID=2996015 RepID=UPI002260DCB3|nr:hypothetical protein [Sulfitobacter sp. F26169L]MCX7566899.1 hypothetical protein [Sulfitobacter sp. F26169L]